MAATLEQVTKVAMELAAHDKLALAEILLKSAEDSAIEAAWDSEIRDRIKAIDEGRVIGIPYEEVMREADQRCFR